MPRKFDQGDQVSTSQEPAVVTKAPVPPHSPIAEIPPVGGSFHIDTDGTVRPADEATAARFAPKEIQP